MARIKCVVLVVFAAGVFTAGVLTAGAAYAAEDDPVVELYKNVLAQLKQEPGNPTAMLVLRPATKPKDPAQIAAYADIVTLLEAAVRRNPKDFRTAHNLYLALWNRYLYFDRGRDAPLALDQLKKAARLAKPGSTERARCAYEDAENRLVIKDKTAATLPAGPGREAVLNELRNAAIKQFVVAKRAAMSSGPYARRAALALGGLYIDKGDAKNAKLYLREALDLDTGAGYITNHAYDLLGLVLLAEKNIDGAATMLGRAGKVKMDEGLKVRGYAHRLARALIESKTYAGPVEYLERAYQLSTKNKGTIEPDFLYALALGYTRMGRPGTALLYWKKYMDLGDPDTAQRTKAKEIAESLAISTAKTG